MIKGSHHTEEVIRKMRLAKLGKITSQETKDKLSKAIKGRAAPWILGRKLTKEHGAKIGEANRNRIVSAITKAKIKANWCDPIYRMKNILAQKGALRSEETKTKMKNNWRNLIYRENQIRAQRQGMSIHPNKPETILMNLLDKIYPGDFKFVGDGEVIIAGKNPDFININGRKQIIEMFGDYWHGEKARNYEETEEGRIKLFKKYGFETLIIWECELKDIKTVENRIKKFHQGATR